ncbi:hypothetical protein H8B13_07465 [Hymenobacter sp. BT188]|uniref:hypothetical protein n=1 Tax=Hymenobacter sp. BT188 TaxID=2763504 RepID=UPI0016518623|nr:hypothetical protein [Hymenobacter sp. BT188]MBC6606652.1 hypothetical protein [Hymenobacter sp. BT188]
MKHLSGLWHKLTLVVAVTAALSSCNRAEYAMLPKTTSYHGPAQRAVTVAPATKETAEIEAAPVAEAPVEVSEEVAMARPVESTAATVAATEAPAQVVAPAVAAAPAKATTAQKLSIVQKALVQKVVNKADKMAGKLAFKQRSEIASADDTTALNSNIRNGIILLLVGLLVSLFSGISGIFGVLGGIISIIGIVLIILGLLDSL